MIYITGDTHGDFRRVAALCDTVNSTLNDILIILGDAGINYYEDYRDAERKKLLAVLPITLFCIHGNHEDRPENTDLYQTQSWNWWNNEQPSAEIRQSVESTLAGLGNQVDVVLSHTCPLKYEQIEVFLGGIDQSTVDKSTEIWLETIEERLNYRKWYCGHYHKSKRIDKLEFLFKDIKLFMTPEIDR